MYYYHRKRNLYNQEMQDGQRILDPDTIVVPAGYQVEVAVEGLDSPISMVFDDNGDIIVADAGYATGYPKVLRISNGNVEIIAEDFNFPLSGINQLNGDIFVSHKGTITVLGIDGSRGDIINGLPSFGDHTNSKVEFGQDNKIYFGQGTATNSGVVGLDNDWVIEHPYFCDVPGSPIILRGINYETPNMLALASEPVNTGPFLPFSTKAIENYRMHVGDVRASGSVLRSNLDGSNLEMQAWGLRDPIQVMFDSNNRLIVSNQGMDNRGSRPIPYAVDTLEVLIPGAWYGWPDYVAGESVESSSFTLQSGQQPRRLLESIPSIPPSPIAVFSPSSNVMGFDINYNPEFDPVGYLYIASFGRIQSEGDEKYIRSGVGHRVNQVDIITGEVRTFAINRSGFPESGCFGRPTDVVFGPDGAMYIVDMAYDIFLEPNIYPPATGVIWRISRV